MLDEKLVAKFTISGGTVSNIVNDTVSDIVKES